MRGSKVRSLWLRLVEESGNYVIGEDEDGTFYQFDASGVSMCVIDRTAESVRVNFRLGQVRRMEQLSERGPRSEKRSQRLVRKCMNCHHPFEADPVIFICDPCKKTTNYRTGSDYSLVN